MPRSLMPLGNQRKPAGCVGAGLSAVGTAPTAVRILLKFPSGVTDSILKTCRIGGCEGPSQVFEVAEPPSAGRRRVLRSAPITGWRFVAGEWGTPAVFRAFSGAAPGYGVIQGREA